MIKQLATNIGFDASRNTGHGISPELLPRLVDLFVQGERSLDRSEGGLGIGLSVVKRLVEMRNGKSLPLVLVRTEDRGLKFRCH